MWVKEGLSFHVNEVNHDHANVAPTESVQISVNEPIEHRTILRIYDVTIHIVDPFGLSIGAAKVKIRLANGTRVGGNSDSNGVHTLTAIPLGIFDASVTNFGLNLETKVVSPSPSVQITFPLRIPVIGRIASIGIAVFVYAFRRKIMRI